MKIKKKIAIFSLLTLFLAGSAQAFSQDYTPSDPNIIYQNYLDEIDIGPSWSNDLVVNKEVVVAVLDSGVDLDHPDLAESIWKNPGEIAGDHIDNDKNSYIDDVSGWDFVSSDNDPSPDIDADYDFTAVNHGTIVAGIIAAQMNGSGIVGIAPQVKIMPLKILNSQGLGNTLVLAQAINYAVENGADVINLSLVGKTLGEPLETAIKNAYNKGVMIVAASGNEESLGVDLDAVPHYPVCDIGGVNRVLGVAALDQYKKMAEFSNYGASCIDISAPGVDFYSTTYYDPSLTDFQEYYQGGWNGTSVAAPIVAATAALIKSQFPDLRPYDIYHIIIASAQDISQINPSDYRDLGAGLIDVGAALNAAQNYFNDSIRIVLAPQAGLPPEVLILDDKGNLQSMFSAYAPHFQGGVNLATGDLDSDGHDEIVTAPMAGGGPHIRVFEQSGELVSEFFAYDAKFTGGVNVALGDVNNDGQDEIVVAPAGGLAPEVKVFNYQNFQKDSFLAYDVTMTSGVNLAVGDVNYDNWPEIITVPAKDEAPQIKLFNIKGRLKSEFLSFSSYLITGVRLVAKDISGDNLPEILALPSKGASALLRVYDALGLEKDNFYLRNSKDRNGYNMEILAH